MAIRGVAGCTSGVERGLGATRPPTCGWRRCSPRRRGRSRAARARRATATSTRNPASAATAGSSDISTPKTFAGMRRSASVSSEYGMTLLSSATPKPGGEQRGVQQVGARLREARDERDERRPDHRDRQALAAVEEPARRAGRARCRGPRTRRRRARTTTPTVSRPPPACHGAASSTMPSRRERDPDEVQPAAREQRRDRDRPEELDRHRDAERDAVERLVERQVHRAEREAEERDEPQRPGVVPPAPRAPHGEQDERREAQAQHRRPGGARLVEQRRRERRAELDRRDAREDERDRRDRVERRDAAPGGLRACLARRAPSEAR